MADDDSYAYAVMQECKNTFLKFEIFINRHKDIYRAFSRCDLFYCLLGRVWKKGDHHPPDNDSNNKADSLDFQELSCAFKYIRIDAMQDSPFEILSNS